MSQVWRCGLVAVLLCALGIQPLPAGAHAGGTPVLTDAPAGPYRVFAWMQPEPLQVGDVHLAMAVTLAPVPDAPTNALVEPVTDAAVEVRFTPLSQPDQAQRLRAVSEDSLNGFYYEIDTQLAHVDQWQMLVTIRGPVGVGTVAFERQVVARRQVNWLVVGGASLVLIVLIGLMGVWNRLQTQE